MLFVCCGGLLYCCVWVAWWLLWVLAAPACFGLCTFADVLVLVFRSGFDYVGLVVGICVVILLYGSCEILVPGLWVVFGVFVFVSWI